MGVGVLSNIVDSLKNANDTAISSLNTIDDFLTMLGDPNGTTASQFLYDLSTFIADINGSPLANAFAGFDGPAAVVLLEKSIVDVSKDPSFINLASVVSNFGGVVVNLPQFNGHF